MLLYHGTNAVAARLALEKGVEPRGDRPGNWGHTVHSRPDCVYLTRLYAGYFASQATPTGGDWGILEIDTAKLLQKKLLPDEDFLEQISRDSEHPSRELMHLRVETFKESLPTYHRYWKESVAGLGNCAYQGIIPPAAITRAVIWDWRENLDMAREYLEPFITLINARLMGQKYEMLTRWLMGNNVELHDYLKAVNLGADVPDDFYPPGYFAQLKQVLANRDGWQMIKGRQDP